MTPAQIAVTALAVQVAGDRLDYLELDDIVNGFMCQPTCHTPTQAHALMRRVVSEIEQAWIEDGYEAPHRPGPWPAADCCCEECRG